MAPPASAIPAPEPVRRARFAAADRMAVQEAAARAVEADMAPFFARFAALPETLGGRYVSADGFKETFDALDIFRAFDACADAPASRLYQRQRQQRQRYTAPLHHASVLLANSWLRRVLMQPRAPGRDTVAFVTGAPGAGKTTAIQAAAAATATATTAGGLPPCAHAIHEGSLTQAETAQAHIRATLDAGLRPLIIVPHLLPERALENTLRRFAATGRGASIGTLARIQGQLPQSLGAIHQTFGDAVALRIIDRRDFDRPRPLTGWTHLPTLATEGAREQIRQRLEKHLAALRERLSPAAWRQASGLPPE